MDNKTSNFIAELTKAIETDKLILPSLPEVALRIRSKIENERCSAVDISELLTQDSAMSAHFIRIANSPLYRARDRLEDLQTIVSRLGMRMTKDLIGSMAMKQIFMATSDLLDQHFHKLWTTSVEIGAVCRMLASSTPHLHPEQAMLAGLIHNIGALPILVMAEKYDLFDDVETLNKTTESVQGQIGKLILETWKFPDELIQVVSECYNFERESEHADYVDLVQVALIETGFAEGLENYEKVKGKKNIPAFTRLNIDPEGSIIEIEENQQMIAEVKRGLS